MNRKIIVAPLAILFTALLVIYATTLQAQPITDTQGDVVIGGSIPDPSAILDLQSTTKGFLIPRMTDAQRDLITNPATGLALYNTDSGAFQVNTGTTTTPSWETILTDSTIGDIAWKLGGNLAPFSNIFGTLDETDIDLRTDNVTAITVSGTDQSVTVSTDLTLHGNTMLGNDDATDQATIAGETKITESGAGIALFVDESNGGTGLRIIERGGGDGLRITENGNGDGITVTNNGAGNAITTTGRVELSGTASPLGVNGSDGNIGDILVSSGAGATPEWSNISGLFWDLHGNSGTTPGTNYLGTSDAQALHLYVRGGTSNSLILNVDRSIQRIGGNARGTNAVDLQISRTAATQVASGLSSTIGGGERNTASGRNATVAGGAGNTASNTYSTVAGGLRNTASTSYATIGGGYLSSASGDYTTIGGGFFNAASGLVATVGGGSSHTASGVRATIGGGQSNTASGSSSTVAGGFRNVASGVYAAVAGGRDNTASDSSATVAGGRNNTASRDYSTIGGGRDNIASDQFATVGGGDSNMASDNYAIVGGGLSNRADDTYAMVGGGQSNAASGDYATVGGGLNNRASDSGSTIGGGVGNTASLQYGTVGGGISNSAASRQATVGGGKDNTASHFSTTVAGGSGNTASSFSATVGGGSNNTAAGNYSAIPGGFGLTLDAAADGSFGFLGGNSGSNNMTISTSDIAIFGNTDLWLANNNNGASQMRFYEANGTTGTFPPATTFYTSFEAGNQGTNIEYTLPTTIPTDGQIISASGVTTVGSTTTVNLIWVDDDIGTSSFKDADDAAESYARHRASNNGVDSQIVSLRTELQEKNERIEKLEEQFETLQRTVRELRRAEEASRQKDINLSQAE